MLAVESKRILALNIPDFANYDFSAKKNNDKQYSIETSIAILKNCVKILGEDYQSKVDYLYFNFLNTSLKFLFEMKRNTKNDFVHLGYSGALYNITREWVIGDCKGELVDVVDALFMVFTGGAEIENIETKHAIVAEVLKEFKNTLKK